MAQRINKVTTSEGKVAALLSKVKQTMGATLNMFATLSNAPAASEGYLNLNGALNARALDVPFRKNPAVTVSGASIDKPLQIEPQSIKDIIMKKLFPVLCLSLATLGYNSSANALENYSKIRYGKEDVDGINIFYREAGDPTRQAVVLLHGFPSSSHMYSKVLEALGDEFYLVAPDYPGAGYSDAPDNKTYTYTFDNVAKTMDRFLIQRGLKNYVLAIQDFGAPIGYRIATANPQKVAGFIVMNGNAYVEGLGEFIMEDLKQERTPKMRQNDGIPFFRWRA